jgi:hypothetical protein
MSRHLRRLWHLVRPLRLPLVFVALLALWPLTLALWMLGMGFVFVRFCLLPPLARAMRSRSGEAVR